MDEGNEGDASQALAILINGCDAQRESSTRETDMVDAACVLWDATTSAAVSEFLVERGVVAVLLAILTMEHTPRLNEAALGTLANVASASSELCLSVSTSDTVAIIRAVACEESDPATLSELCRLFLAGLSHAETRDAWIGNDGTGAVNIDVAERVAFWLSNSLDQTLVISSARLAAALASHSTRLTAALCAAGLLEIVESLLRRVSGDGFAQDCVGHLVSFLFRALDVLHRFPDGLYGALAGVVTALSGDPSQDMDAIDSMSLLAELVCSENAATKGGTAEWLRTDSSFATVIVNRLSGLCHEQGCLSSNEPVDAMWSLVWAIAAACLSSDGTGGNGQPFQSEGVIVANLEILERVLLGGNEVREKALAAAQLLKRK